MSSKDSPLYHYNSNLDAIGIIQSHENKERQKIDGRLVNFLGVIIDPAFLPHVLEGMAGHVEGVPIPANWHADIAEFAACLRAVDLAQNEFRVLELGCGWGCWLLNTGVAARSRGLRVTLIGVEADTGHAAFAERGCAENGFLPDQISVHRAIVGAHPGTALFPNQDHAGGSWGLEPVFEATEEQIAASLKDGRYDALPVMPLAALTTENKVFDLVHLDIQGGEADFVTSCMDDLLKFAAYVVIGTHSRSIEGRIMDIMLQNGWTLEMERPAVLKFHDDNSPYTSIDGVQGWRNSRLRPY